jgi:hypothetical protein
LTSVLWLVSIEPARAKPPGPVIAYDTELSVVPGATCNASPSAPNESGSELEADAPELLEQPEPSAAAEPSKPRAKTRKRRDDIGGSRSNCRATNAAPRNRP